MYVHIFSYCLVAQISEVHCMWLVLGLQLVCRGLLNWLSLCALGLCIEDSMF